MGWNNSTLDAFNSALISLWKLDEPSETRYKSVGQDHLQEVGSVGSAAGIIGDAADFPGDSDSYLECPQKVKGLTKFSSSYWFYMDSGIAHTVLKETRSDNGSRLVVGNPTGLTMRVSMRGSGSTWYSKYSTNTFSTGQWYHVLTVIDTVADYIKVWVNTIPWIDSSIAMPTFDNSESAEGLRVCSYTANMDGKVDQLVLWNDSLGLPEAQALYNSGAGREYEVEPVPIFLLRNRVTKGVRVKHASKIKRTGNRVFFPEPTPPPPIPAFFFKNRIVKRVVSEHKSETKRISHAYNHYTPYDHYYSTGRGIYRDFEDLVFRYYRTNNGIPPSPDDEPFDLSAPQMPYTPPDTFADGVWFLSVSYYNGLVDSGFLPLGPHGETYLRIEIVSGEQGGNPPGDPNDKSLLQKQGGVIRIDGFYASIADGVNKASQWAIWYTTDGVDPIPTGDPDLFVAMPRSGLAILAYSLPAEPHGTTVKVILKTRRNDGTEPSPIWVYSEDETVMVEAADAEGPETPPAGDFWRGMRPIGI